MKNFRFTAVFLLTIGIGGGCERPLEVDVPEEPPRLVINSLFAPYKTPWEFSATRSQPIIGPAEPEPVLRDSLRLKIFEDDRLIHQQTYAPEAAGWITLPVRPQAEKTYRLEAATDSLGTVTAETTVPPVTTLRASPTDSSAGKIAYRWRIEIDDIPEVSAYMLSASVILYGPTDTSEGTVPYRVRSGTVVIPPPTTSPAGEQEYLYDPFFFTDHLFSGKTGWIEFELDSTQLSFCSGIAGTSCALRWTLTTLSPEAERYYQSYQAATKRGGGLFQAPATIYSNVRNGIGIWAAANRTAIIVR